MFLSDFSIKRPIATIVLIIADGLGLLALKKLRVNEIPDVEQPSWWSASPTRRVARDRGARGDQPHREIAAEHLRRLRGALHRQATAARIIVRSSTSTRT
jgi:hypothetical protein